jgi:DNA-binding GntR family transcriptional regulator
MSTNSGERPSDSATRLKERPSTRSRRGGSGGRSPAVKSRDAKQWQEESAAILDILRERIARHELSPGAKLREAELSEEFNISRARVREILGALEQRGLIERIPNRGAVVIRLTQKQAIDLFNVREMLEALAVRLATEQAPSGTWDEIVARFNGPELEAELNEGYFQGYIATLEELRELMILHADNDVLREMLENIHDKSRVLAHRVIILPHRWPMALQYHRAMVQAMAAGDAVEAERRKREIISSACAALRRYRDFVF